jgi:hypothetical protein
MKPPLISGLAAASAAADARVAKAAHVQAAGRPGHLGSSSLARNPVKAK